MPVPGAARGARRTGIVGDFGPAVAVAALIFALSSLPITAPAVLPAGSDLVVHAGLYAALAAALARAWRRRGWAPSPLPAVVALLYGVTDELHQMLVPGRSADLRDLAADAAGASAGWALARARARRRGRSDAERTVATGRHGGSDAAAAEAPDTLPR